MGGRRLSLSHCSRPQASGSTAEGGRRGGGYCTVPVPVLPDDRARVQPMFPPLSATLTSLTLLPLLCAPQTRERRRAVGAGRRLQLLPGSLCWAGMLWVLVLQGRTSGGSVPGGEGLGHTGHVTLPLSVSRAAMPPWKQSSSRSPGVLASGHPSPRSSGSISPQGQNANYPRASPSLRPSKSFLANKVQVP